MDNIEDENLVITTQEDFQKISNKYCNFIVYLYSSIVLSCQELLSNNKIIKFFINKKIKFIMIDAQSSISLRTFLGISFFPIFLIYNNRSKIDEINGTYENILEVLDEYISNKLPNNFLNLPSNNLSHN